MESDKHVEIVLGNKNVAESGSTQVNITQNNFDPAKVAELLGLKPETGDSPMKPETVGDMKQIQRRCRRIYFFMADYILQMLLKRWGKTFEDLQARRIDLTADTGRPKLIDRLPHQFSRDQLRALIQEQQVATPDRVLVSQWKANNWIQETDKFLYKKLI